MRMDPCAGGVSSNRCDVELHVTAQPFGDFPPAAPTFEDRRPVPREFTTIPGQMGNLMFDVSVQLIYKIGKLKLDTGETLDDNDQRIPLGVDEKVGGIDRLVQDLLSIKAAASVNQVSTIGRPLGVHPGLRMEANNRINGEPIGNAVIRFIRKYSTVGGGLKVVKAMFLAGPKDYYSEVAIFFQGIIEKDRWVPVPVIGNNIWAFRTNAIRVVDEKVPSPLKYEMKIFPPPEIQNLVSIGSVFEYVNDSVLPNKVADLLSYFDNPGRLGSPKTQVGNIETSSVRNTDCVSCHMSMTRMLHRGLHSVDQSGKPRPTLYLPPVGTTAYVAPEVISRNPLNLRIFGYYAENPTFERPVAASRVANESAEVVNFINSRFLFRSDEKGLAYDLAPNPGLKYAGEDTAAALKASTREDPFSPHAQAIISRNSSVHAALLDCLMFPSSPDADFTKCSQKCNGPAL